MIQKTAYNKETGKILYSIEGDDGFLIIEETDEVGFVSGSYDPLLYRVVNGLVEKKPYPEIEAEEIDLAWVRLRSERSHRLFASDWTQVADAPVDRAAWATYRQALRDLPANTKDPREVIWPTPPTLPHT